MEDLIKDKNTSYIEKIFKIEGNIDVENHIEIEVLFSELAKSITNIIEQNQ